MTNQAKKKSGFYTLNEMYKKDNNAVDESPVSSVEDTIKEPSQVNIADVEDDNIQETSPRPLETSPRDVPTSLTNVPQESKSDKQTTTLNIHDVATYIYDLDLLRTNVPVTLSSEERSIIDQLLIDDLRKITPQYKHIGLSRLMRLCTMYMIKYHKRELLEALSKYLIKPKKKSIF